MPYSYVFEKGEDMPAEISNFMMESSMHAEKQKRTYEQMSSPWFSNL